MGRFPINRAQLCRLTSWIDDQHHRRSVSSTIGASTTIFSLTTRFRHCSMTPDSETLNVRLSANHRNSGEKMMEKERAKRHETVRKNWRDVEILTCESSAKGGVCDVYLVGVFHGSQKSCTEVQEIIKFLKPEVVFLELCESRGGILTSKTHEPKQISTRGEIDAHFKIQPDLFAIIMSWVKTEISEESKVFPGSEFRVAYEEAIKYGGRVALGDRPVKITLERARRKIPLWDRTKMFLSTFLSPFFTSLDFDKLQEKKELDNDMIAVLHQELNEFYPSLMKIVVHERHQFMSYTLLKEAIKSRSVVAVVGKGNVQGIKKYWKQPVMLEDLMKIPSTKATTSRVSLTSVMVAGAVIIYCFYFSSKI